MGRLESAWETVRQVRGPDWAGRLVGPVFDKELRVSSRRKFTYVLRIAYMVLLLLFVVTVWWGMVGGISGPSVYREARMAEAGRVVIMTLTWFQFIVLQLVAGVILCGAISEEVHRRTLAVLLATPVTAVQVVAGKLASRLLQVVLLLAISVPVLVVVRVLGGIQAEYLVASTCMTLSAVIFVGALSLFYSVGDKRPWLVFLKTLFTLGLFYGLVPVLITMGRKTGTLEQMLLAYGYVDPFLAMIFISVQQNAPRAVFFSSFIWPIHCGIMLLASGLLLAIAVAKVRVVALGEPRSTGVPDGPAPEVTLVATTAATAVPTAATTQPGGWVSGPMIGGGSAVPHPEQPAPPVSENIRRVSGSPVVWKELHTATFRSRAKGIVLWAAAILVLLLTYALVGNDLKDAHGGYGFVLAALATLAMATMAATTITSEKESQTWAVLLTTPLSSHEIVWGKAAGALRRSLPVWSLFFLHLIIFTAVGQLPFWVSLQVALAVAGICAFVVGVGLYSSAVFRKTTSAVVVSLLAPITVWGIFPLLLVFFAEFSRSSQKMVEHLVCYNPFVQIISILCYPVRQQYEWPDGSLDKDWPTSALIVLAVAIAHVIVGVLLVYAAGRRLRRTEG
jgi:ABC-type transport system involved in multi-copper enzyme maturation permease subunit